MRNLLLAKETGDGGRLFSNLGDCAFHPRAMLNWACVEIRQRILRHMWNPGVGHVNQLYSHSCWGGARLC